MSLDPRVTRLPKVESDGVHPKAPLDQFGTFEVFVQPKEGKPFQHEGIVHAPNLELAYVLAKEAFTRRFTCTSLYVVDTRDVFVSTLTEGSQNAYDVISVSPTNPGVKEAYHIYHLPKRGKQHVHAGTVQASTPAEAMTSASEQLKTERIIYNIWAIRSGAIRFTHEDEGDLWLTLPEKKFRDAAEYKGGDKLKMFLDNKITT